MRTNSLEEYADAVRGGHSDADLQWLEKRLRSGVLPGYKAGRKWRATDEQIAEAVARLTPEPVALPDIPVPSGMTRTSRRRLMRDAS
ncbi:DNA-binding protein [Mycolicibacterium llatzerense]|uniref:DNA-binding protein n=1 Tax=Mycolicibacterium llatzerense TaxID=280871 RepID=UPI0031D778EE